MMDARLPSKLWVEALVRRVQLGGASAFVVQTGDADRGDVLIKVADLKGGAWGYVPRTTMEGERIFIDLALRGIGTTEAEVDDYVARARSRDSDLWVVEIEDREARHFLTEDVETVVPED